MSNYNTTHGFVELNRTFHELSNDPGETDDIAIRRALHLAKPLSWADLTQEFRVVVLSEAGTGKTEEIRHLAKKLRGEGKAAFFIRLEHITDHFDLAFEVGTFQEFEAWLVSSNEGWFLLDSIDEARLRSPGDFELAIRSFARRVTDSLQRVHIIITGRTTAWRPKSDLNHCVSQLPYEPSIVRVVDEEDNKESFVQDGEGNTRDVQTEDLQEKKGLSVFKIVSLDDLNSCQIGIFAAAKGVKDTRAFLQAIERADAWPFTARPQDLEELAEFWIDRAQIGSRFDIVQKSIDRRLTERDQERADVHTLSCAHARDGARLVAASATLAQEQIIRVQDGADGSKGIPVADILPDWDVKDQATLLSPIFDEAIYGTVRFHHRSVREFLMAEWLAELLKRETSRRKIEALLFRSQYGLEVVVPTLRPILPWLAILDDKVRERLCRIAPKCF